MLHKYSPMANVYASATFLVFPNFHLFQSIKQLDYELESALMYRNLQLINVIIIVFGINY